MRSLCVARETLGRASSLADFAFAMQGLGSAPIALFGRDDQKQAILPRIAAGTAIAAVAFFRAAGSLLTIHNLPYSGQGAGRALGEYFLPKAGAVGVLPESHRDALLALGILAADEITAKLRALRASGPVSVDTGRGRVLDVLQPYIDDLTRRKERGARRAAADIATAVLLGLYECREDTDEDMLLVRMGLPGAADDLARIVYAKVKPLHLSLPSLADECPEWEWYEESWNPYC